MALFAVRPTQLDKDLARAIADRTDPPLERGAEALTWAADEHVLLAAAVVGWVLTRKSGEPYRRLGTHFLLCSLVSAILPHVLKTFVDQERPDRLTVEGHLNGVPLSGKPRDAFPSGHALHVGALASAATLLRPGVRNALWAIGAVLAATRLVLLAHWLSDVVAGLGLGVAVERAVRRLTRPLPVPARQID
jgi:membrane-associated phospholipid phosphatase